MTLQYNRHDVALAKQFWHSLQGEQPGLEELVNLVKQARETLPSPGRDIGPWHSGVTDDGRSFIASDDFTHDVRLYLDGDFATPVQKRLYLQYLTGLLNAAMPERLEEPKVAAIEVTEVIPAPVTGEQVQARRREKGISIFHARQELEDERVAIMIGRYKDDPDHLLLAEILSCLAPRRIVF